MSTAIQKVEPQNEAISLLAVIERAATDKTVDVDKMERLLAMHERIVAKQAEAAFNDSMRKAQSEMPIVPKDALNPSTNSRFAKYETLWKAVTPIISANGFSQSFGSGETSLADHYRVQCIVSHTGGHSRTYQADLPADYLGPKGLPNKTKMHGFGSTMSYGRRYLTALIFNIALIGEDKDGNTGQPQQSPRQATEKTRSWFLQQIQDIRQQAEKYAWDKKLLTPEQPLTEWPLDKVPMTSADLVALREQIKSHK